MPSVLLSALPVIEKVSLSEVPETVLCVLFSLVWAFGIEEEGIVVTSLFAPPQPVRRNTEQIRMAQTARIKKSFFILVYDSFTYFSDRLVRIYTVFPNSKGLFTEKRKNEFF